MLQKILVPGSVLCLIWLFGCATVQEMAEKTFEKPKLSVEGARVQKLSFEDVTMLFDIRIENPNIFGLSLAGLTYDFKLNDNLFFKGEENTGISIPAQDVSVVQLPLTFRYDNVYKTIRGLDKSDKTRYGIDLELAFDIPVIGFRPFSLSHYGEFPLPKLPSLTVDSIKLEKLTVSQADLSLNLKVKNPNVFAFAVNKMNYNLVVSEQEWLNGFSEVATNVAAKQESIISFPISLKFLQIGRTVFTLLNSGKELDYQLKGGFKIAPALSLIPEIELPFDESGKIPLSK